MPFVYVLTCIDCAAEWRHERDSAAGRRPKRCPGCTRQHKLALGRAATQRWNAANPEARRQIRNRWTQRNPDAMDELRQAWRAANPERVRAHRRAAKKRNPVANRSYVRARKARQMALTVVPISARDLAARLAYYGGRCWICGSDERITLDHVKPLSAGGAHMLCNLRPACDDCNSKKGAMWPFPTSRSFPGWDAAKTLAD